MIYQLFLSLHSWSRFLYQLSLIPNFTQRLNCLLFSCTFADSASSMTHKLSTLQKACDSLRHSKPVSSCPSSAAVPLDNNYAALFYLYLEPCSLYLSLCSTSLPSPPPLSFMTFYLPSWPSTSPQLHDVLSPLSFMMFYLWYLRWAMWWTVAVRSEVKLMVSTSVCCLNWWTSRQHKPHPLQLKLLPQQPLSWSSLCPILSNTRLVVVISTHTSTWRLNCHNDMQCSSLTAFPLPDPSTLLAASQIQFDELYSELELLTKQLGVAKCHLSVVQDHSASHSRMQHFLSQSMSSYYFIVNHITL